MPEDRVSSGHEDTVPDLSSMENVRKKSRANLKYGVDRNGLDVLNINLRLGPDLLIGVEKYAKAENFEIDVAVMELLESGLLREGHLPKWWRIRGFDR